MADEGTGGPYGEDLARIHDAGHVAPARAAAETLLTLLEEVPPGPDWVVDLGCGSGVLAAALTGAGHRVLGIDLSPAMLRIARRRAPGAAFVCASVWEAALPPAIAVCAVGEVLNYRFRAGSPGDELPALLRRIAAALRPGGVLLFDVAGPGRSGASGPVRSFRETPDWAVLVETEEHPGERRLSRRIVTFVRRGESYRRSEERHELELYPPDEVVSALRDVGLVPERLSGYRGWESPPGWHVFVARKPGTVGR